MKVNSIGRNLLITLLVFILPTSLIGSVNSIVVEKGAEDYLETIFGKSYPTLADYYNYEGSHAEWEVLLEDKYCEEKWGGIRTKGCKEWLVDRSKNKNERESLFYKKIRETINLDKNNVDSINILRKNDKGTVYFVRVIGKNSESLDLRILPRPRFPEIGNVHIEKVGNKKVDEIVK